MSEGTVDYIGSKRIGPTFEAFPSNPEKEFLFADQELLHLIWVLSRKSSLPQQIPSWTGFNITIRGNTPILESTVSYLNCIDAPATDPSAIYMVMERCLAIKERLKLKSIVCVFNQAIYAKAVEIKWKKMDQFKDCVVMLGIFHLRMMYLGIIGKRFKDAGLRDVLVQSQIVAEGSIERALTGKIYNRAVRCYKLMYEALMILLIDKFHSEMEGNEEKMCAQNEALLKINELRQSLNQEKFEEIRDSDELRKYKNMLMDFRIKIESNGGDLCKFWLSFLDMVNVLLFTLYATRSGNWDLLLECVREITIYAFAYDNYNYARYLPAFLGEIIALETTHPEVYKDFQEGQFAVQLSSNNPFGRVEADKTIETTINKDTRTPGGTTKNFSTNPNAVYHWTINASYRAAIRNCFQNFLGQHHKANQHQDLRPSRITHDEHDVSTIIQTLHESFIDELSQNDLVCISNGVLTTGKVRDDLIGAREKGEAAMETFIETRLLKGTTMSMFDPIKKFILGTFSSICKNIKITCKNKEVSLRSSRSLFAQICIVMQRREIDLKKVLKYP